jgi:F420-0:gamma-glutamyl ligase-like protein
MKQLPESDFETMRGRSVYVESHFVEDSRLKDYADERLALELRRRFGAQLVANPEEAERVVNVFYTSLATDQSDFGISIPLGFVPRSLGRTGTR